MDANNEVVLEVRDLAVEFQVDGRVLRAVDGVSWTVRRGRTLALVGESGCGKSVTGLSLLRLVPDPPGRIAGGQILFHDPDTRHPVDLAAADATTLGSIRGRRISMIFQEAMTALNPVMTVGQQIVEAIELHRGVRGRQAWQAAIDILRQVGIPAPEHRARDYPHRMSGGMRQRAMIGMALACDPAVLVADEPTTALDVTVQAQILDLLRCQQARTGMSMVFITHDLGVVARIADEVCVMYAGRVVELAGTDELLQRPAHPYTRALLRCVPRMSANTVPDGGIPGQVPELGNLPTGCRFHPRCPQAVDACRGPTGDPPPRELSPGHVVACSQEKKGVRIIFGGAPRGPFRPDHPDGA